MTEAPPTLVQQLVSVARAFAAARGLSLARVSTITLNRGATLELLEQGKADVNTKTLEKAMRWFSANWPAGAAWPEGVARPDPAAPEPSSGGTPPHTAGAAA